MYLYISVKGYVRIELCEDIKRRFYYKCNIYSDTCFTSKHLLRGVIFFSCIFKSVLNKIYLNDHVAVIKLVLMENGSL